MFSRKDARRQPAHSARSRRQEGHAQEADEDPPEGDDEGVPPPRKFNSNAIKEGALILCGFRALQFNTFFSDNTGVEPFDRACIVNIRQNLFAPAGVIPRVQQVGSQDDLLESQEHGL